MKLADIYQTCVRVGREHDARDAAAIQEVLDETRRAFDKLEESDKRFFDSEKLTNPYADTRICAGDPDLDIRGMIVGVDMETAEVLLADRLREKGVPIDLVFAHHPEGPGYANLHEVMYMQADLWAVQGVSIAAGDALIAPRAAEIRRRISPVNHYRGYGPEVIVGEPCARAGRVVTDMTGGTEGPTDVLNRLSAAGVGTLVGMHYSEEHKKRAEELKLNLVIAGHISSDVLGMNLVLDEIERLGPIEIVCASGMVRVKRSYTRVAGMRRARPDWRQAGLAASGDVSRSRVWAFRSSRRPASRWSCRFRPEAAGRPVWAPWTL